MHGEDAQTDNENPNCSGGSSNAGVGPSNPGNKGIGTDYDAIRKLIEEYKRKISELENLTKKIAHQIQQAIGLAVKVKLVEPRTIERSMGKAVHVIDKRKLI